MRRKVVVCILALIFGMSSLATNAMAFGLGFNLSGGGGSTEWDPEVSAINFDTDDSRGSVGFVLDTTVAKNFIFNYRLNIGSESVDYEREDGSGTYETKGWFMAHDFGFAIIRKKHIRLWAGPEIRWSYTEGEQDTNKDIEMRALALGIGPVVGLNLNFGKRLTLAFKAGALAMTYDGALESKFFGVESDIEGEGSYSFVNVGLIFRLGDEYKK